jgi:monovalent cation:H+ antiporter, CPA1 family
VLVWGGLRGTIALALVLSVPASVSGRQTLQVLTFGVVLLSLLVQGLTLPPLVRKLDLVNDEGQGMDRRERQALLEGFVAAHEELDHLQEAGALPRAEREHLARTIEEHEAILLEGLDPEAVEPADGDADDLAAHIGALVAQRRRIEALRLAGAIARPVAEELVGEIDDRLPPLVERLAGERGDDRERSGR